MRESIPLGAALRVVVPLVGAAALVYASYLSLRLSYADLLFHRNTTASVRRAAELDPHNGRYQAWLAELLENDGQDGALALHQAARVNPLDSRVWIRLGLAAETAGDRRRAENLLLHAASIDRLLEPRWALMNFYFRSSNEGPFWPWAKEAFAISYGDRTPLFDLCWRVRDDTEWIAKVLLPDPVVLTQFVRFLVAKERLNEAAVAARRAVAQAGPDDIPVFTNLAGRLVQAGETAEAVPLWNALCERRLLPFAPLDPARGHSLTNGGFEQDPSGAGFDWRVPPSPGVTAGRSASSGGFRFTFSGTEPDACDLISQTVPLEPSRNYRLRITYRTSGISAASGLNLRAAGQTTELPASDDWTTATLPFSSGGLRAGVIALDYRRPPGVLRIEGRIEVRGFSLDVAP